MSEMNIVSRLDSYVTNVSLNFFNYFQFTMPWDKKPVQSNTVYATVGAVACYKFKFVQEDNDYDTDFEF